MRGPWPAVVALVTLVTVILLYAARGNMPALLPSAAGSPARLSLKDRQIVEQQCSKEGTKPNSKRILLTGAAGFVGFHSSQAFKGRGDVVVGIDNFNDYYPVSLKRARRGVLREKAGIHIVEADINDMEVLTALFDICNFTHVVDLAAQAGVRYAMRNPMSYVDSNLKGERSGPGSGGVAGEGGECIQASEHARACTNSLHSPAPARGPVAHHQSHLPASRLSITPG